MRVCELVGIEADPSLPVLTLYKGVHYSTSPSSSLDTFYLGCWRGKTTLWGDLVTFASGMRYGYDLEIELRVFKEKVTREFSVEVGEKAIIITPM